MMCDQGFGHLETEYRRHQLHCPQDFFEAASKLKIADVVKLCADDILDLKKLANDHFKHNRAKNLLFSRAKRVFLSKEFPLEMILQCYDIPKGDFETETVYLAHVDSEISKQKTTEEFHNYYLKKSGKSETEQQKLLPTLRTSQFNGILPKKFRVGQVMEINKKKIKDLNALRVHTSKEAQTWILEVTKRQGEGNLRKRSQIQNDEAIYDDPENDEDEQDLEIDQEDAVVINEDYHDEQTKEEPEKPKRVKRSGGNKKPAGKGNLIINLNLAISNNNAITLILNNEMNFNTKTINIHKVLTITFL